MKKINYRNYFQNKTNAGFTLIELLLVISIIALLSSVVLSSLNSARDKATNAKITEDLRQFGLAQQLYFADHGEYAVNTVSSEFAIESNLKNDFMQIVSEVSLWSEAEAYNINTCDYFVVVAEELVAGKYLSSVPKHPKDDGQSVCYKAVMMTVNNNFVAYADLIGINKRVGIVLGELNSTKINDILTSTNNEYPRPNLDTIISVKNSNASTGGNSNEAKTNGEECTNHGECSSGICGYPPGATDDTVKYCTDGSYLTPCLANDQCAVGLWCSTYNQCTDGSNGTGCQYDNDCTSNYCEAGMCADLPIQ